MATNPYFTQLHTQRFSFIGSPQQRDGTSTKDQRFLNCYPELIKSPISDGKKYYLKKRPGIVQFQSLPSGTQSQGIYYWQANNSYYYVIDGILYANGTNIGNFTSASVQVGFVEFRSDAVDQLFMCDGTNGWVMSTSNVRQLITDANFPKPHIPNPIFMDGYIFLAATTTQTIHNSNLQDPTTWPADGFIDAEMYPDNIVALSKSQNYVVAVGTQSVEFFYDNANATGSPLQRNAPAVSQFGCPAPNSVNQTEKELILIGNTNNGGNTVWVIDGFQPSEIANEPVREALDNEGANIINANAFTIQVSGHKFYVMNLPSGSRTFVYDFEEKMWHEWSSGAGNSSFQYRWACNSANGYPVMLPYVGGPSMALTPTAYDDAGTSINVVVRTMKIDFDNSKRKRCFRCSLVGDVEGNSSYPIYIGWSDDDYNTTTPSFKPMDMSNIWPTVTQLGYFRRRAWYFIYNAPFPLRLESFELDITEEVRR